MRITHYFILLLIFALACKSQQTGKSTSQEPLEIRIAKKIGDNPTLVKSFDGLLILASSADPSSGTVVLKFGVWDLASGDLVYAGSAIRGKVDWLDNNTLLVEDYPGIVQDSGQNFKYKINVHTKVKIPLNESSK